MSDRYDPDPGEPRLPPELEELHRSLSDIRMEERASFGPELQAELEQAWRTRSRKPRDRSRVRPWMAAAAAAVVLTFTVPPARGALARILEAVQLPEPVEEVEEPLPHAGPARGDGPEAEGPTRDEADPERTASPRPEFRMDVPALSIAGPGEDPEGAEEGESRLPGLRDRRHAEELIRDAYPAHLQRERIGGTVRILLYVEPTGDPNHVRVRRGSGVDALDRAAVDAARRFDFSPAVHDGVRVGQWVEFDVRLRVPRSDPSLSDLHLVPSGTRPAEAAELRALDERVIEDVRGRPARGELGVFFQLHDLPEGTQEYELRATLEPEDGGERTRLRLHPQDEGPFRPSWIRTAAGPGSAREYVLIDFSRVEPGDYLLRLEAVLTGSERIVESTRSLRVR